SRPTEILMGNSNQNPYDRYLKILGIERQEPSISALYELVAAQMTRVPFENISKLYYLHKYNQRDIPTMEQYLDGVENHNLGGTCFANNYFLHQLLTNLGYKAKLCGADMDNPDVHLTNIVDLENREYLIDAGYATPFIEPLPRDLREDYHVALGRDEYILHPKDDHGRSRVDLYRDNQLIHGYTAKPIHQDIKYFKDSIAHSFREEATFLNSLLMVRLYDKNRSVVIFNLSVIQSEGPSFNREELKDKNELIEAVHHYFGIPKEISTKALKALKGFDNAWN
ncbi:MAG: arylamine N-acetyltransferase, partial [Candidatus Zixiibacteriota bacterium]